MHPDGVFCAMRCGSASDTTFENKHLGTGLFGTALALKRAAMLRIYRHYMPALLFITAAVDLAVIGFAMLSSQWFGFPKGEGAMWLKMAVVFGANLLAFYMFDLYKLDFQVRRVEIVSRLLVALG